MRQDRYVVPVKAEHKGAVPGLVHDISASGATLFIEPMAAVKANNELRELSAKEKLEIERILAELSADCAEHRDDISSDFEVLVRLDFDTLQRRSCPINSTARALLWMARA